MLRKVGGGGVEGATAVGNSPADGYMIGVVVIDIPTMHVIRGNAPYGADAFEPAGILTTIPFGLVALRSAPYDTHAELAEYARENPVRLAHFGYDLIPTAATFAAAEALGSHVYWMGPNEAAELVARDYETARRLAEGR